MRPREAFRASSPWISSGRQPLRRRGAVARPSSFCPHSQHPHKFPSRQLDADGGMRLCESMLRSSWYAQSGHQAEQGALASAADREFREKISLICGGFMEGFGIKREI